jgi:hypothetical protein
MKDLEGSHCEGSIEILGKGREVPSMEPTRKEAID